MNPSIIPPELLIEIFQKLTSVKDISECQIVCKNWRRPAQIVLCRDVILTGNSHATTFLNALDGTMYDERRSVMKINMYRLFDSNETIHWDRNQILVNVVKYCYNLKVLHFAQQFENLWSALANFRCNHGYLLNIEEFSKPSKHSLYGHYVETVLQYKDSLAYLYILRMLTPDSFHLFDRLSKVINQFKYLIKLEIEYDTRSTFYVVENIVNKAPALETLIVTGNSIKSPVMRPTVQFRTRDLSTITSHASIKSFTGNSIRFNDAAMLYFMHKFPNIEHFTLNDRNSGYDVYFLDANKLFNISFAVMWNFVQYLSKMKSVDIFSTFNSFGVVADTVEKVRDMVYACSYLDNHTVTLNIMYENRLLVQDIHYPLMTINTTVDTQLNGGNDMLIATRFLADDELVHQRLIRDSLGQSLRVLCLDFNTVFFNRLTAFTGLEVEQFAWNSLNVILSHCLHLDTLTIGNMYFGNMKEADEVLPINNSIKTLNINSYSDHRLRSLGHLVRSIANLQELNLTINDLFDDEGVKMTDAVWNSDSIIRLPLYHCYLNNVSWKQHAKGIGDNGRLYLCIANRYYFVDEYGTHDCSMEEYRNADKSVFRFEITCESLQRFTIDLADFYNESKINYSTYNSVDRDIPQNNDIHYAWQ